MHSDRCIEESMNVMERARAFVPARPPSSARGGSPASELGQVCRVLTVRQAPSPDALQRALGPALPGARGRGRRGAGGRGSGREGRGEPGRPRSGRLSPAVSPSPSACVSLRLPLFLSASSVSLGLSASLSLTLCPPRPTPSLTVGVSLGDDVASSAVADLPSGGVVESGGGRARGSGRWVGVSTRS